MTQLTQSEALVHSPAQSSKRFDLWIAGAVVLGVVFVPALVAWTISLFMH